MGSMKIHSLPAALLLAALLLPSASARGQFRWPEEPENVQVLPDSIRGEALGFVMRSFAGALGVRCSHCHVGEEGAPLSTYDFPADDKETKRIARVMIEMVMHINDEHLSPVDTLRSEPLPRVEVTCKTCHRGITRPRFIEDIVAEKIEEAGFAEAEATYRQLREEHYGDFAYDFSYLPLGWLGEQLAEQGNTDDAIAVLTLALEFDPEATSLYYNRAQVYAQLDDRESAIADLERALESAPEGWKPFLERALERLRRR